MLVPLHLTLIFENGSCQRSEILECGFLVKGKVVSEEGQHQRNISALCRWDMKEYMEERKIKEEKRKKENH